MSTTVKFIIGVMSLFAALLTFFAAVLNTGGGGTPYDPANPGGTGGECVYDGSYDACGGSR